MKLQPFQNYKIFDKQNCDFCGLCFHKCPVLELPLEEAIKEIKSLVNSGKSKKVLTKCTSCMACNHYCPNNCNPHTLILKMWNERYLKNGVPYRAKLAMPYHFPNLYTININKLPKDEFELIKKWEQNWKNPPENHDTMLYTGCNFLILPYILSSKLFDNIPIFGSPELCCGEPLYRMGCLDAAEQVAYHLQDQFEKMGFKKLVIACFAGYHVFKEVFENLFGVKFNFECISIIDWLWDELNSNTFEIKPLNINAVIHDNCWPKASGDRFFDHVREILDLLGVNVIEPEHSRENALCCGIGAAAANYSIKYAFKSAKRRLQEFKESNAEMVIDYCGGCNWYFATAQRFSLKKIPIYHIIEIIQMAIGETPLHRIKLRGKKIIRSMVWKGLKSSLTKKKYTITNILDHPVPRKNINNKA